MNLQTFDVRCIDHYALSCLPLYSSHWHTIPSMAKIKHKVLKRKGKDQEVDEPDDDEDASDHNNEDKPEDKDDDSEDVAI